MVMARLFVEVSYESERTSTVGLLILPSRNLLKLSKKTKKEKDRKKNESEEKRKGREEERGSKIK